MLAVVTAALLFQFGTLLHFWYKHSHAKPVKVDMLLHLKCLHSINYFKRTY